MGYKINGKRKSPRQVKIIAVLAGMACAVGWFNSLTAESAANWLRRNGYDIKKTKSDDD